jgi:hypothetical protein
MKLDPKNIHTEKGPGRIPLLPLPDDLLKEIKGYDTIIVGKERYLTQDYAVKVASQIVDEKRQEMINRLANEGVGIESVSFGYRIKWMCIGMITLVGLIGLTVMIQSWT